MDLDHGKGIKIGQLPPLILYISMFLTHGKYLHLIYPVIDRMQLKIHLDGFTVRKQAGLLLYLDLIFILRVRPFPSPETMAFLLFPMKYFSRWFR